MRQRGVHRDVVAARARVRSRTSSRLRCVRQRGRSARRCGCRPRGKCGAVSCAAAAASTSRGTRHSASCAPKRRPTSVRPRLAPHSASSINARRQAPPRRRGGRRRRRGRPPPLTTAPSSHGELEAVSSQRGAKLDAAEPTQRSASAVDAECCSSPPAPSRSAHTPRPAARPPRPAARPPRLRRRGQRGGIGTLHMSSRFAKPAAAHETATPSGSGAHARRRRRRRCGGDGAAAVVARSACASGSP